MQDTPSKVARNYQDQDEEPQDNGQPWIEVRGRKRRTPLARNSDSSNNQPLTKFRLRTWNGHANSYQAIKALERDHPALNIRVRQNLDGLYVIRPMDAQTEGILLEEARSTPGLEPLDGRNRETKAIVMNYPIQQVLDPLQEHKAITSAERCIAGKEKHATRQVMVTFQGPLPDFIDLGAFGKYKIRKYEKEPLRCYKCQRYGHHKTRCTYSVRCGVCSQGHDTNICVRKHKDGEVTHAKCCNCGRNHHVWFPRCLERLNRIRGILPREETSRKLQHSTNEAPQQHPSSRTPQPKKQDREGPATPRHQQQRRNTNQHSTTRPSPSRRTPNQSNKKNKNNQAKGKRWHSPRMPKNQTEQRQELPSAPTQPQQRDTITPRQSQESWPRLPEGSAKDEVTISRNELSIAITKIVEGLSALSTLDAATLSDAVNQIVKNALGVQSPKAQTNLNRLYSQMAAPTNTQRNSRDPRLQTREITTSQIMDDDDLPDLPPFTPLQ